MKERPIIFSGPMVHAILASRKTQTRRVIKAGGYVHSTQAVFRMTSDGDAVLERWPKQEREMNNFGRCDRFKCPYGVAGDRLIVKEATWLWCERRPNGTTKTGRQKWHYVPVPNTPPVYVADHPSKPDWGYPVETCSGNVQMWKFKTARFMPRWASRITLEITNVRVRRVQEISEEDGQAEGCEREFKADGSDYGAGLIHAADNFKLLWDSINAKRGFGWTTNPWVWAISFKRVDG